MKKLLLLTISLLFISCASYKPQLVEDKFYKSNTYFTTYDWGWGGYYPIGGISSELALIYKSKNGTSNIIMIMEYRNSRLIVVDKTDEITIRYKDGSTSTLEYTSRVSDYRNGYFFMYANSDVISEYKDMDIVRIVIDGTYQNIEVTDKSNKELRKIFDDIQKAADDYYK